MEELEPKTTTEKFTGAIISRRACFVGSWLPVVLWMAVIFILSTDLMSSARTSRFIGPVLRWFIPDISNDAIGRVQYVVRKGGHMVEYAILAGLFWRARRRTLTRPPATLSRATGEGLGVRVAWSAKEAWVAIAFSCVYAMSDEFHQHFVASREGSVRDVLIDTAGAMFGMGIVRRFGRYKKWW